MSRNFNGGLGNKRWGYFWPAIQPDLPRTLEYMREWHDQCMPTVKYYRLLTTRTEADPVHQEIDEYMKRFSEAVNLVTFVQFGAPEEVLKRFSLDVEHVVTLVACVPKLLDVRLAELSDSKNPVSPINLVIDVGDHFEFDNRRYAVVGIQPKEYYANIAYPLYFEILGTLWRNHSFNFNSPVT